MSTSGVYAIAAAPVYITVFVHWVQSDILATIADTFPMSLPYISSCRSVCRPSEGSSTRCRCVCRPSEGSSTRLAVSCRCMCRPSEGSSTRLAEGRTRCRYVCRPSEGSSTRLACRQISNRTFMWCSYHVYILRFLFIGIVDLLT